MRTNKTANFLSTSIVGQPGVDTFGVRSRQELVRDEVAFAPGVDPHRGLILMIERMNAYRARMPKEEEDTNDVGQLLPAG